MICSQRNFSKEPEEQRVALIPSINESDLELECGTCHHRQPYQLPTPSCDACGGTWMDVRYDLGRVARLWPTVLHRRSQTMWRYRELLPLRREEFLISMGEGGTPLLRLRNLGLMLKASALFIKDERQNPTGSFKDRQAALVISLLKEAGVTELVVASTGNVAISYSAYSALGGIRLWTFLPSLVPPEKMREIAIYGSKVIKVSGTYDVTKKVAAKFAVYRGLAADRGIRDTATRESMKTLAYEIAEQLSEALGPQEPGASWRAPDWYVQAVSGGLGPVGVSKGFEELQQMGLVHRQPKLALVQAAGCAPMVRAHERGLDAAEPVVNPTTRVITIATGDPGPAYTYLHRAVHVHGGEFVAVSDEETFRALHMLAKIEGISVEPAAATAFAGYLRLLNSGVIKRDEIVVINCSGHTFPVEKFLLGDDWAQEFTLPGQFARDTEPTRPPAEPPTEGVLAALEQLDRRTRHIVIVEDHPDAARLLRRILQARGDFQVSEAHSGREALALVEAEHPDVVLLDLMLPDMDGFEVLDRIRATPELASVHIVVITAKDLTAAERRRLSGRIHLLFQKGAFTDEDLIEGIEDIIGGN